MTASTVHIEELPYCPDSCDWFERIRHLPGALLLDSCHPYSNAGRFDIMAANPLEEANFSASESTNYEDIFKYFEELAGMQLRHFKGIAGHSESLPFCGGLAGCLDYGLGKPLQHLPAESGAQARVNLYGWALVQDHLLGRCTYASLPGLDPATRQEVSERLHEPRREIEATDPFAVHQAFLADLGSPDYGTAFSRIQDYIHAGDCYQVNLARRFCAAFSGDPWLAYRALRPIAAAPFSAYMDSGDRQLLCLSPERFLRVAGRHVETRPIKGTRPRFDDPIADQESARALLASPKDRAENLMIVDLLRNDISRNCAPGTVRADRLFELESYPSVHHLVSTVSGELATGAGALDLLRDAFPGGSITGAPKRRAMQVIDELETGPREAYCGSVFYLGPGGGMDSNIAIRSLVNRDGQLRCWGGGGIVADSDATQEYRETWDKVGRFLSALETANGDIATGGSGYR